MPPNRNRYLVSAHCSIRPNSHIGKRGWVNLQGTTIKPCSKPWKNWVLPFYPPCCTSHNAVTAKTGRQCVLGDCQPRLLDVMESVGNHGNCAGLLGFAPSAGVWLYPALVAIGHLTVPNPLSARWGFDTGIPLLARTTYPAQSQQFRWHIFLERN